MTDTRTAEDRLRDQNADLQRQVFESGRTWAVSPDCLCVFEGDGRFSAVNPAWTGTFGFASEEYVGALYSEFLHPDDAEGTLKTLEALQRDVPVLRFDNRYRCKDGSWRWLSWVAVPQDGRIYCSARDVTEDKAQADALAASTAERDRLWSLSQDMFARADYTGTMSAVSPAWTKVLGWTERELLTRAYASFMHPDDLPPTLGAIGRMAETREPARFENRIATSDGGWKYIEWTVTPEPDGVNFIAVGRDLTATKAREAELAGAQEALRQSQKMEAIGQLTGGVAHDFNNLLTVIRGSVDLLRRPDLSPERRDRYIDAIGDTADRAAKLTGQLLAFARRQALTPALFDVGASIEEVGTMVRTLAGSRIVIDLRSPKVPLFVLADRSQLDNAIINLSVNARDAMQGEGRITIAIGAVSNLPARRAHENQPGDYVAIAISDEGTGIAAEDIERVFEPFFTTKVAGHGTGLGLSQVIGFAKQSGGDVTVESEPGRGTTFTLYLPRVDADGATAPDLQLRSRSEGEGVCVLLVEDNPDVGEFAVGALQELGFDSVLARDGKEALAELEKDCARFHILFTDVVMPGIGGIELAQRVRHDHPHLPIILTSGYSHVLAENGAHGFELLHKPYSIDQLSRVLHKAIAWHEQVETA